MRKRRSGEGERTRENGRACGRSGNQIAQKRTAAHAQYSIASSFAPEAETDGFNFISEWKV